MSESYITIVPINVTHEQANELSQKTIDWLIEREIISKDLTDCVLGQDTGYPPGSKYKDAIDGDDLGLLKLWANGLSIINERRVFDNGGNGLNEINCTKCGANNIDSDWAETIGLWVDGKNDKLKCSQCDNESSITDYRFRPDWGFDEFCLTFWNWPSLTTAFLNNLRSVLRTDIRIIYGRI